MNLFIIQSHDKKYFCAKGLNGHGNSWVNEIEKARIYGKIGSAKSVVGWWINNYPDFPSPSIVQLGIVVEKVIKIDSTEVKLKKLKRDLKQSQDNLEYYQRIQYDKPIESLKRNIQELETKIQLLK